MLPLVGHTHTEDKSPAGGVSVGSLGYLGLGPHRPGLESATWLLGAVSHQVGPGPTPPHPLAAQRWVWVSLVRAQASRSPSLRGGGAGPALNHSTVQPSVGHLEAWPSVLLGSPRTQVGLSAKPSQEGIWAAPPWPEEPWPPPSREDRPRIPRDILRHRAEDGSGQARPPWIPTPMLTCLPFTQAWPGNGVQISGYKCTE